MSDNMVSGNHDSEVPYDNPTAPLPSTQTRLGEQRGLEPISGVMTLAEADAFNVEYTPPDISTLHLSPIRNKNFKLLCIEHQVAPLFNAEYLVWLWNDRKPIRPCDYWFPDKPDDFAVAAWFLEEDAGQEIFWRTLKEQAAPPMQPQQALITLWREAKSTRIRLLRDNIRARHRLISSTHQQDWSRGNVAL
jgi:hypothetical protein